MIKVGFLFLLGIVCLASADNVPVLMFQKNSDSLKNAVTIGQSLDSDDFASQLASISGSVTVVLVDELNDQDLRKLLNHIQKNNVHYEPLVESAYPILKSYLDSNEMNSNVEDYKMNVQEALDAFEQKQATFDVVILTALKSKELKSRISKRQVDDNSSEDENMPVVVESKSVFGDKCAMIFDSIYLVDNSGLKKNNRINLELSQSNFECAETKSSLKLTVSSNQTVADGKIKEVNLNFQQSGNTQYWGLAASSSVVTSKKSLGLTYMGSPYGMETPNAFSFVCTKTYFQLYDSSKDTRLLLKVALYIENMQIQPNRVDSNGTMYTFGKVNYCQGFFTSGIWMALISSLLLTLILAMGVAFLFNINTMDRFDDPKGKPLVIAQEK